MVHNSEVNSRFKVRSASARCRLFSGCSPFLLALPLNASVRTTVFNECYMSHRRLTKDLCASVPGGLGGVSSIWSRALV